MPRGTAHDSWNPPQLGILQELLRESWDFHWNLGQSGPGGKPGSDLLR